ncbi:MAG: heavy metal translocating P-type ATPase [Planctomycetota bacterium]|jgi:heavy metal translocating P-type ATPase
MAANIGEAFHYPTALLQAFLSVILLISPAGGPILVNGLRSALYRAPNMDLLIAMGVLVATLGSMPGLVWSGLSEINHFHEAAMILIFINVGKHLEERAKKRASSSLSGLISRTPRTAMKIIDGTATEVPVETIRIGDILQVAAESYVPVDGKVRSGRAAVDMSMWTGESAPVEVGPDHTLPGGVYIHSGKIDIQATALGADSAMARIVKLVEEAQTTKTRMQRIADRVAGVFVPMVIAAASITAACWLVIGGENAGTHALSTMVAVLVVACPCAMGLATPTAVLVATGTAALKGIIVRNPAALELAGSTKMILLDKTGTLTTGKLIVSEVWPTDNSSPSNTLQLAASAEQFSPHPLAKAIVDYAKNENIALIEPTKYAADAGLGVSATINGQSILVGSEPYLERNHISPSSVNKSSSGTLISVACNGQYIGTICLDDTIRDAAAATVKKLKNMGLVPALITGDRPPAASKVAEAVDINLVYAENTPDDKIKHVRWCQSKGDRVIMVGDGINDAAALAAADVGIAMTGGTDLAAEAADIGLVDDRIELLPMVISLARKSTRIIKQNLFWAFAYNVVAIPLAAVGILPAGYAAAAMMCSSISVVLNSLRVQR